MEVIKLTHVTKIGKGGEDLNLQSFPVTLHKALKRVAVLNDISLNNYVAMICRAVKEVKDMEDKIVNPQKKQEK